MGESNLGDTVTGHEHYLRFLRLHKVGMLAEERIAKPHTPSNGHDASETMQENLLHMPDRLPLWVWLKLWLEKRGLLVAPTRQEGRYSISQPLVLVMVGILGTAFFAYWWRSSDVQQIQRDEIIRLQTRLDLEKEKNLDQDSKIDQARATAQIADKNAARLEGKFDQFALQYATGKKKPPVDSGEN